MAGGLIGASTGPNVVVAQSAKGIVAAAVGEGVGVGVGATAVGVVSAGSGALALFTPMAMATMATTTTAPDPTTSGRRRRSPDESLIDSLLGLREPARGGARVVRDDHVGTRAADATQGFKDGGTFVEGTRRGRVMEHGKLPADAVGGEGQIGRVANPGTHIEVGERELPHDHVRALLDIEEGFANSLTLIGRVHLVRTPVSRPRRAF